MDMSIFDFTEAGKDILKLNVDGKVYSVSFIDDLLRTGIKLTHEGADVQDPEILKKVSNTFFETAKKFTNTPPADANHTTLVRKLVDSPFWPHVNAETQNSAKGVFDAATALETELSKVAPNTKADESTLSAIKKILVKHPEAKNVLGVSHYNMLHVDTVDVAGKATRIVDLAALEGSVNRLRSGIDSLAKLYESGDYNEKKVRQIFLNHPAELRNVIPPEISDAFNRGSAHSYGKPPTAAVDIFKIATNLESEIASHSNKVVNLSKEVLTLKNTLETKTLKSVHQKALDAKLDELTKYVSANKEFEQHVGEAVQKAFTQDEQAILKAAQGSNGVFTTLTQAAERGGEGAAKKGGGLFGFFRHSEESLAEMASKKNKPLAEIGKKVGDIRWGRAAMVGLPIAAIGAYFLAGTGNKPGRHTEAEFARQQQGQEAAMGRA
jgi:hypothetical protein